MSVSFFNSEANLADLSDSEFLGRLRLSDSATDRIRNAAQAGDSGEFFTATRDSLASASRRYRKVIDDSSQCPSLWSVSSLETAGRCEQLIACVDRQVRPSKKNGKRRSGRNGKPSGDAPLVDESVLREWIDSASGPLTDAELLVLTDILLVDGPQLGVETFGTVWRRVLEQALAQSAALREDDDPSEDPEAASLLNGELPLRCGLLFSGIAKSTKLAKAAAGFLRRAVTETTDTDGTPHASVLPRLPFWLAPFVRGAAWAKAFRLELFRNDSEDRFDSLVGCAAVLCSGDGRIALCDPPGFDAAPILQLAAGLSGLKKKSSARSYLDAIGGESRSGGNSKNGSRQAGSKQPPVFQSDWAAVACLRNRLSVDADSVVVAHGREQPLVHLSAIGSDLICGAWELSVEVDSQPVVFDDWSCVCWFTDRDGDYLELQADVEGVGRIDRQILLSRREHFMILADSVRSADSKPIEYHSSLPLVDGIDVEADRMTREVAVTNARLTARVFPLFLDQDKVNNSPGQCTCDDGLLRLHQSGIGGVYSPIVLDWHPDRTMEYVDWQRLTVTEAREVLHADHAAAYRLRVGAHQLMIYRSLHNTGELRAVLGHHTGHEAVIANFSRKGEVQPLVLVES